MKKSVEIIAMSGVPLASNVCDQLLRELGEMGGWSLAHVIMSPGASSLRHRHHVMQEIYIVTRGSGFLTCGDKSYRVQAGDAVHIPVGTFHRLINTSLGTLEHLVLAAPSFDSGDIEIMSGNILEFPVFNFIRPLIEDCFDGAHIVSYGFDGVSVAFGWMGNDPERRKPSHYHLETTEWIYVVEGKGWIVIDDYEKYAVTAGSLAKIGPGIRHAISNESDQSMVVVCISTPAFNAADVHFQ